ncbi:GGDEF domain-containing protein [Sulfurospirillum sp. 1307]|jgi:diguanylate cyclase (GGDEF)-like protein
MNKKNTITDQINEIGESTFKKLQELQIPPYPKYYHDTFIEELSQSDNPSLIGLHKKYSHLFSLGNQDEILQEISFELAKTSLKEFEQSNSKLKEISDENIIDVETIKNDYDRVNTRRVIDSFAQFQYKILEELKNADETITKLKLEIERLEKESHIDPLTKAYNRRVFNKDIKEILDAIKDKKNVDLFLVLFDADDFKNINDSYGHLAGDKTLIFLAKLIQSSIRKGIKIYRYGGEEFIIILNRVTIEDALRSVERIVKEVDESKLLYKGHSIHLTISAGIGKYSDGDIADILVEKADKALYEAKKAGKNCVKVEE